MHTITINEIRSIGKYKVSKSLDLNKSASQILNEVVKSQSTDRRYDIFLSHSFKDADIILGIKIKLEKFGYTVFVDWFDSPEMDRSKVNSSSAKVLRDKMDCCKCLFYATTENATYSKWMPWECGYFDGKKGRSAIFPLTTLKEKKYSGQEYLGLYPYITEGAVLGRKSGTISKILWVCKSPNIYCPLDKWLSGGKPIAH